jgi:tetratricopeptide (TPR) repeat protein
LKLKERFLKLARPARILISIVAVIIVVGAFTGGIIYIQMISNHPTHGGGSSPFSNRTGIWSAALTPWENSRWFGIGPGRLPFGYMEGISFPPGWLAPYAHSAIITSLVELGIFGLLGVLAFAAALVVFIINIYRAIAAERRGAASAVIAGMTSFYVYNLLDDTFMRPETMTLLFFYFVGWLFSEGKQIKVYKKLSIAFLGIPLAIIAAFSIWSNWAYIPASDVVFLPRQGNWTEIAQGFSQSAERDPNLYLYASQGGYAWANAYAETGDEADREQAILFFEKSIALEPSVSLNYANLAVLVYPDDASRAIDLMKNASEIASDEVSYPINLGWFYENQNEFENAATAYYQALTINPNLSQHPFWSETQFRRELILNWLSLAEESDDSALQYWQQAQKALEEKDFEHVRYLLASARWADENLIAVALVESDYYSQTGESEKSQDVLENLEKTLQQPYSKLGAPVLNALNAHSNRIGLEMDVVPGYILLYEGTELLEP